MFLVKYLNMSCIAVKDNLLVVAKGLYITCYDYSSHNLIEVPSKSQDNDNISDVEISSDNKYLALITSISKQLIIYDLPYLNFYKSFVLPRSASKLRFTANNSEILIADKSGDVLKYNIKEEDTGTKLLGHLSLLLDVLQTGDEKFIITSDRDEKIKVSCYPNTYNIQTYCLGHREFVNHLELVPHCNEYLSSASGDGTVKIWNYSKGTLSHSFDTCNDINDTELKQAFIKSMDEDGVEVKTLPIVHYTISQLNENTSLIALAVHTYNTILVYSLQTEGNKFGHKLQTILKLEYFPSAIKLNNLLLYVYDNDDSTVYIYEILCKNGIISLLINKKIKMFEQQVSNNLKSNYYDSIKMLYKRKFDNVQEYQERKKKRLEKSQQ